MYSDFDDPITRFCDRIIDRLEHPLRRDTTTTILTRLDILLDSTRIEPSMEHDRR